MSGFSFGRSNKGRKIELFSGKSVVELERFLAKSRLLVIPKRDLVLPDDGVPCASLQMDDRDSLPDLEIHGACHVVVAVVFLKSVV